MMKITPQTQIQVMPEGHLTTFGEFLADNVDGFAAANIVEITAALANEGSYFGGGGAAGDYVLIVANPGAKSSEMLSTLKAVMAPYGNMDADAFVPSTAAWIKSAREILAKAEGSK